MKQLSTFFQIEERQSSVRQEILAGVTTFMALSYIIFVQPALLSGAGTPANPFPKAGIMIATCVASAIACLLMGLLANYPIALAPAMGHNVFFVVTVCGAVQQGGLGFTWQQGLAAVCVGGAVFMVLSFFGFRARIMSFIPDSLKRAIAGGIGLLLAVIGLEYAGLVVDAPGVLVNFGDIHSRYTLLAVLGLGVSLLMLSLRVRGAILVGIASAAAVGCAATALTPDGWVLLDYTGLQSYRDLTVSGTLFHLDFGGLFTRSGALTVILTFLFLDVFDTVGTLVGVSEQAGLLKDGELPRARWALFSDATGTVTGALMGTSTITSYVESAAGVQAGARTGLAAVTTAVLFLASILLYPILAIVASSHEAVAGSAADMAHYPVLAPALIVVGAMMLKGLSRLDWEDPTEFLPAFLTVVLMPLTVSITEGIAFGFISYSVVKLATGRQGDVHWAFHVVSAVLVLRYMFGLQA